MSLSDKPGAGAELHTDGLTTLSSTAATDDSAAAVQSVESEKNPASEPTAAEVTVENIEVAPDDSKSTHRDADASEDAEQLPKISQEKTPALIVERLRELSVLEADDIPADEITKLKLQFYSLHNGELREKRQKWIDEGNPAEAFELPLDPVEEEFKALMSAIKDKKTVAREAKERQQAENLTAKKEIIEKIVALAADTDNVNRHYQEAKDLQTRFKEIGEVPPQATADIWKQYQDAVERFYDQLKINMELRDYDFKKNLAEKQLLIDEAEKLKDDEDIVVAFRRLQLLHDKWRLIGPVAKELRDEIWAKFKDASVAVNKRYQEYFEERKAKEREAEAVKTALCERVEALDWSGLKNYAAWDEMTRTVIAAQEEWKSAGFTSRKLNNQLFNRFREACDKFFTAKAEFFRAVKDEQAQNLLRKTELAEKAEALKHSTEWRKTTDELVKLQQEWKTIGMVAKKHSDALWKRFHEACDHFFEQKKKATGDARATEQANLKAKLELIDRLKAITTDMPHEEAIARLREVQAEWPAIGHVPFREKDKIYEAYREQCNKLYKELDVRGNNARIAAFAESVEAISGDDSKLMREREKLARALESRRNELLTYENNVGFLSSKSKSGDSMIRQMEQRIQRLREEIATMEEKLKVIDSKL